VATAWLPDLAAATTRPSAQRREPPCASEEDMGGPDVLADRWRRIVLIEAIKQAQSQQPQTIADDRPLGAAAPRCVRVP
jgi:hypothetical protein